MNTKKLAGTAAVGAVSAVTTLLLGATPAFAQEDSSSDYAFAFDASGLLDINELSYVESTDGALVSDELLSIGDVAGEYEDDISFGLLTAEAESHRAETAVKEVNVLNLLRADVIRTWCDNGEGGVQVVNGTILGQEIPDTSLPGETIDLSPLLTLSMNDQVRNADGSLTVTGIELRVLPGAESNPDEQLSEEEKAALPELGGLLGTPLTGADTVRDVLTQLGGPLALDGDLQTITIGQANCQEGAADGANGDADGSDDGDGNGDGDGDGDGNGGDDDGGNDDGGDAKGDDSEVKSAPAPSVVQAALPVTG